MSFYKLCPLRFSIIFFVGLISHKGMHLEYNNC